LGENCAFIFKFHSTGANSYSASYCADGIIEQYCDSYRVDGDALFFDTVLVMDITVLHTVVTVFIVRYHSGGSMELNTCILLLALMVPKHSLGY
jgi:hypothetical protein